MPHLDNSPAMAAPVGAMAEILREAAEARGCATADDLRRDGFDDKTIERFGHDATVEAARRRDRDLAAEGAAHGPEPVDRAVGARIRLARLQAGLTQEKLAEALGVTFQQLQKYEKATNRISASKLHRTAAATGKPVSWFFDGVEDAGANALAADLARSDPALVRQIADLPPEQRSAVKRIVAAMTGAAG